MKNSQRGSAAIVVLLVIIALLVIGFGVYIYLQNTQTQQEVSNSQSTTQNTQPVATSNTSTSQPITNGNTTSSNQTAGWKTYANSQYGFQFKYPQNYSVSDGKPNSDTVGVWFVWVSNQDQTQVGINVYNSNLTLAGFVSNDKNFLANNPGTVSVNNATATTVGGLTASKLVYSYSGKTSGNSEIYYVKKGDSIYRIQLNNTVNNSIGQQIVSQFTFTK